MGEGADESPPLAGLPSRVTLVISSLSAGGAERVLSTMANYWAERGRDVTLVTIAAAGRDFYVVHPRVTRVGLDLGGVSRRPWHALRNNARRVRRLRRAVRESRPQAVISFMTATNVVTLLASWGTRIPVVVSERVNPTRHRLSPVWEGLRRLLYPRASAVVVQTLDVRCWAESFVPAGKVHVVPNPVPPAGPGRGRAAAGRVGGTVVAVGRLEYQKGFDLLIRAFAECRADAAGWVLTILGEGSARPLLADLAVDLGVAEAVDFAGTVRDAMDVLRRADLFVLSSRYEGFPNALLEAMACGVPVVAADCPSGPRDIVRHEVDGLLVPPEDVGALAAAMRELMRDEPRRIQMGEHAMEVRQRFALGHIMEMWDHVLASARNSGASAA